MMTRTYEFTDAEMDLIIALLNQEHTRCQETMIEYDLGLKDSRWLAEAEGNNALTESTLDAILPIRAD